MKILLTILAVLAVLIAGALFIAYSGVVDVSALGSQPPLVEWFLVTTREHAVEARAEKIAVPELDRSERVESGLVHYHSMCVACHGAPGRAPSEVGKGLNPMPPDLTHHDFDDEEAAEAFWILQNGIRMTGMPAFGATHTDDELWDVVAFLKRLPELSPEAYAAMVAAAGLDLEPSGHHHGDGDRYGDEDGGAEESTEAAAGAPAPDQHHDDGHEHHPR